MNKKVSRSIPDWAQPKESKTKDQTEISNSFKWSVLAISTNFWSNHACWNVAGTIFDFFTRENRYRYENEPFSVKIVGCIDSFLPFGGGGGKKLRQRKNTWTYLWFRSWYWVGIESDAAVWVNEGIWTNGRSAGDSIFLRFPANPAFSLTLLVAYFCSLSQMRNLP